MTGKNYFFCDFLGYLALCDTSVIVEDYLCTVFKTQPFFQKINTMLKNLIFLFAFIFSQNMTAQVAKSVVVEHFTNTRCGICGFKNPQLFANLNNHPEVLHLATHPSSPYSNCVLYQHNPDENDARTNFYGVYGGTPRIVIQGEVMSSSTSYTDDELFTPYEGQTSPASINIQQSKTAETIEAFITVQTEELHNLGDLNLYVVVAEDTVFYEAPNGEDCLLYTSPSPRDS